MTFDPAEFKAKKKERRKGTAQQLAYGTTAATAGTAGLGVTAAKWTPEKWVPTVERTINNAAAQGSKAGRYIPPKSGVTAGAAKRTLRRANQVKAGTQFRRVSTWAKANPRKAIATAGGLKAGGLAAGVAAKYRNEEGKGLSMDIGQLKAAKRQGGGGNA